MTGKTDIKQLVNCWFLQVMVHKDEVLLWGLGLIES